MFSELNKKWYTTVIVESTEGLEDLAKKLKRLLKKC